MNTSQDTDLFDPPASVDAICITTNGVRKANGNAVMGAGIALTAAKKWPSLPVILGTKLRWEGLHTTILCEVERPEGSSLYVLAFPTKNDWKQPSRMQLVLQSTKELVALTNGKRWQNVWLPPPGCGNGGLYWSDVARNIGPLLNERFTITFRRRR